MSLPTPEKTERTAESEPTAPEIVIVFDAVPDLAGYLMRGTDG